MGIIYLLLFALVTVLHLYGSWEKNDNLRNSTKGMILITLMGFYVSYVPEFSWLLIAALLTSWAGDVLLIPKGVKWFTAGGIFFLFSHLLFILGYNEEVVFANINTAVVVILVVIVIVVVSIIFKHLKQYLPKALVVPMFCYLCTNGFMNCFAIFRMLSNPCLGTIITAIGALGFFISDSNLFFVRFNKECRVKSHFLVMTTYSLGEFLIILGFIL